MGSFKRGLRSLCGLDSAGLELVGSRIWTVARILHVGTSLPGPAKYAR